MLICYPRKPALQSKKIVSGPVYRNETAVCEFVPIYLLVHQLRCRIPFVTCAAVLLRSKPANLCDYGLFVRIPNVTAFPLVLTLSLTNLCCL